MVLHLKEHKPAALRPLDDVREDIRQKLRLEAAKGEAKQAGEDIVKRVRNGEDITAIAAKMKLTWERLGFVGRERGKGNPQVIEEAFKLMQSDPAKPVFDGMALTSGDYAVIGLYGVKEGDPAGADKQTVDSLKTALTQEYGQGTFEDYVEALKKDADIKRFPDKL